MGGSLISGIYYISNLCLEAALSSPTILGFTSPLDSQRPFVIPEILLLISSPIQIFLVIQLFTSTLSHTHYPFNFSAHSGSHVLAASHSRTVNKPKKAAIRNPRHLPDNLGFIDGHKIKGLFLFSLITQSQFAEYAISFFANNTLTPIHHHLSHMFLINPMGPRSQKPWNCEHHLCFISLRSTLHFHPASVSRKSFSDSRRSCTR